MSKYTYNEDYFKTIDSEEKAYWLGFLYADGCICRNFKNEKLKSMSLELTLCAADMHHLEKFNNALKSNVPIKKKIVKGKDGNYESYRLAICCTKLCRDLCNLGCIPQKTYVIALPSEKQVPKELMKHFIRGFFDGDGCICITEMCDKPHIELTVTGMENMLVSIYTYLISEKVLRVVPKIHKDKRSQACSFYMYGEDAVKDILDYLYKDAKVYLDRKYNKYIDFYKNYDENKPRYGVYWSDRNKAYIVRITINGKTIRIGQYKDVNEANKVRKEAEIKKMNIENAS